MSELETQIRGYLAKHPDWDTWNVSVNVGCSERTVRRIKQKIREEKEVEYCKQFPAIKKPAALDIQVDGNHYKKLKIQPVEYIYANGIGFFEGNVIKYVTRWRDKGGLKDLEKAIHNIQLLIELENSNTKETL